MVVKYCLNLVADNFSVSPAVLGYFGNILFSRFSTCLSSADPQINEWNQSICYIESATPAG